MQPSMLLKLLRKLTVDVSKLSEYTTVALRVSILFLQQIHLIAIAKPMQFKQVKCSITLSLNAFMIQN